MELEIFNCEQNSPEWIAARLGVVTASEFKAVMAKGDGKTRRKYLLTVVGELIGGDHAGSLTVTGASSALRTSSDGR